MAIGPCRCRLNPQSDYKVLAHMTWFVDEFLRGFKSLPKIDVYQTQKSTTKIAFAPVNPPFPLDFFMKLRINFEKQRTKKYIISDSRTSNPILLEKFLLFAIITSFYLTTNDAYQYVTTIVH